MGQVLHKCARTTAVTRAEIQHSKKSLTELMQTYGVSKPTIIKWRRRAQVEDDQMGTGTIKSSLSELEQQAVCEFRIRTQCSLDDCFIALTDEIPSLTRSNLHRCFKRNEISTIPKEKMEKKPFKVYPIGYIHIDITEVRVGKDKYHMFVAVERLSKMIHLRIYDNMTQETAFAFLNESIKTFPFKITHILTDNGLQFTYKALIEKLRPKKTHGFDEICNKNEILHRLTKFRHPWTNGQVERYNRIIKYDTTKKYKYKSLEEMQNHLTNWLFLYNIGKRLKTLKFKTPMEKLKEIYDEDPLRFHREPVNDFVGRNSYII
jgi:transposase-like protein